MQDVGSALLVVIAALSMLTFGGVVAIFVQGVWREGEYRSRAERLAVELDELRLSWEQLELDNAKLRRTVAALLRLNEYFERRDGEPMFGRGLVERLADVLTPDPHMPDEQGMTTKDPSTSGKVVSFAEEVARLQAAQAKN